MFLLNRNLCTTGPWERLSIETGVLPACAADFQDERDRQECDICLRWCLYCVISQALIALLVIAGFSWIMGDWFRQRQE
jgi:hypothetical protein